MADSAFMQMMPPELQAEQQNIARRQAISQAIMAQMQRAGQPVTGRVSPLAPLTAALGGMLSGMNNRGIEEDRAAMGKKYQTMLAETAKKYLDTSQGVKGEVVEDPVDGWRLTQEGTAPNPRQAAVDAISSGIGPFVSLGLQDIRGMKQAPISLKDFLPLVGKVDPASIQQFLQTQNFADLKERPELKVINNQAVPYVPGQTEPLKPIGDFRDRFEDPSAKVGPDGRPILLQRNLGTNESKSLGGGGTTVNVGEKVGGKILERGAEHIFKDLEKGKEKMGKAIEDFNVLRQVTDLFHKGVRTGSFTEFQNDVAKLGETLNFVDPSTKTSNTDLFLKGMAKRLLAHDGALGAGTAFSDTDRKFLEKVMSGRDLGPDAMEQFLDIGMRSVFRMETAHKLNVEKAAETPHMDPAQMEFFKLPLPPFSVTTPDSPVLRDGTVRKPPQARPVLPSTTNGGMRTPQALEHYRKYGVTPP